MSDPMEVSVVGLREFNKALKQVGGDLPKGTRLAFNEAANLVVDVARPKVPKASGKAAKTVKAASTRRKARVSGGSNKVPYYGWLDFGGRLPGNPAANRPYKADGRYIYMAYFKKRDSGEFAEVMEKELLELADKAGLVIDG